MVLAHFDFRQLIAGSGDHWVAGGALAISTVTAGRIAVDAEHLDVSPGGRGAFKEVALVLWLLAMLWFADPSCSRGDAPEAELQRQALVNSVPIRHVRRVQLRRWRSHRHTCDH